MKDEDKTKAELVKELKTLRKERRESALNDLTERKQVEEALRESEAMYSALFETAKDAVFLSDETGRLVDVNQMACESLGYNKEELLKLSNKEIDADSRGYEAFLKVSNGAKERITFEVNQRRKDGTLLPVEITGSFFISGGQRIALAIARDITKRKQAEERVKHLDLVLHAIRNVNQLIVKEKDLEKLLKGACNNLIETRGYYNVWIALLDESGKLETYAEAGIGKKAFLPVVEMLKKDELIACGQKALKQQEVVTIEDPVSTCPACPLVKKHSGRSVMIIRLEHSGKVYGLMSVSIPTHISVDQEGQNLFKEVAGDIAFGIHNIELDEERKQAEENLKKAKDELQMIMDSVPALIFYKDTEGRIVRANKALADSLKMSVKDIVGKTTEELFLKEQAENMRKYDKEIIISGKPKRNIIQPYTTPDGIRWAITDKVPYKDKEGKITGVIGLSKDITVQKKAEQKLKKTMDAAIDTMSNMIEAKDPYTFGHQHRVCQLAVPLAQELGLDEDKIEGIRIASLIHDIGKIGLPTEILSKPTKLTDIEFGLIKGHSQTGHDILKSIDFPWPVAQIVFQHHEKINGSGYPQGLKGDEISIEAKIIGVVDVVEAMSSHRPYRPALGIDKALEEIFQNRGILYDPEVVDVCLRLFKEKKFKFES